MTGVGLLLPIAAPRGARSVLVAGIAGALAMTAIAPLAARASHPAWLLARATEGEATARRRAADRALLLLRAQPGVAAARRVPVAEMLADLREAAGTSPPDSIALPELVEARLAPGVDPRGAWLKLRRVPGLAVTVQPGDAPLGRDVRAAGLLALGVAAAGVALATILEVRVREGAIGVLHRLGATRARIVAEAALPAFASAALGIVLGTALASLLPHAADGAAPYPGVAIALSLVAAAVSLGSALRRSAALA